MARYLVISDIHGCYDELNQVIKAANYNPDKDNLIILGDHIDRGPNSKKTILQLMNWKKQYGVIILKGDHEDMFLDWIYTGNDYPPDLYLENKIGGLSTIKSYLPNVNNVIEVKKMMRKTYPDHLEFISLLPLYHESEKFIFVHAGIDPKLSDWKKTNKNDFLWIRDSFLQSEITTTNKTVVFGHTRTHKLHNDIFNNNVWTSHQKIGIDGACAYGGQLNCLELNDDRGIIGLYLEHNQQVQV